MLWDPFVSRCHEEICYKKKKSTQILKEQWDAGGQNTAQEAALPSRSDLDGGESLRVRALSPDWTKSLKLSLKWRVSSCMLGIQSIPPSMLTIYKNAMKTSETAASVLR